MDTGCSCDNRRHFGEVTAVVVARGRVSDRKASIWSKNVKLYNSIKTSALRDGWGYTLSFSCIVLEDGEATGVRGRLTEER